MGIWLPRVFTFLVCTAGTISAAAIQNGGPQTIQLSSADLPSSRLSFDVLPPINFSKPSSSSQELAALLNVTATEDDYNFSCHGSDFGRIDDIYDCLSALERIGTTRDRVPFAQRGGPGVGQSIFPLPWRWMGQRATCYIQPVLRPGAEIGSNSLYKIREAASALITHCAARQGQGGMVTNIGGDNNLALTLGIYEPHGNVVCVGQKTFVASCREIVIGMPVSREDQYFGSPTDPRMAVEVPHTINSDDAKCSMKILTTNRYGMSDMTSWYKAWEAVTAVFFMCIGAGRKGSFRGLGYNHELFITIAGP